MHRISDRLPHLILRAASLSREHSSYLAMKKLRLREAPGLALRHTADEGLSLKHSDYV